MLSIVERTYCTQLVLAEWRRLYGVAVRWQEADLAVAPLTITAAREQMIDFSTPFFDLGLSILIARAERGDAQLAYAFLEPFALDTVRSAHVSSSPTLSHVDGDCDDQ